MGKITATLVNTVEMSEYSCTLSLNVASTVSNPFSSLIGQKAKGLRAKSALNFFYFSNVTLIKERYVFP